MIEILRPLSVHEASFPIYAELSPGGGNIVCVATVAAALDAEAVRAAIARVHPRHALLAAGYRWLEEEGEDVGYVFTPAPEAGPELEVISVATDDVVAEQAASVRTRLLNHHFLPGHLLYRAAVVSGPSQSQLLLCISHAVADGASATALLKQWLQALVQPQAELGLPLPLPAPLWAQMPKRIASAFGAFRALGVLFDFIKMQKAADRGLAFATDAAAPYAEHRSLSTKRRLAPEAFAALRAAVKAREASLHGVIGSAFLRAFLADCEARNALAGVGDTLSVPLVTTVDVRRYLPEPVGADTPCCLSSGVTSTVQLTRAELAQGAELAWTMARQIADGVQAALAAGQHWKVLRIYQLAGFKGLRKMFIDSAAKPMATPVSLANLGAVDIQAPGLAVTEYEIYAAFHVSGAGMNVTVNSCHDGLTLCFTCPAPLIGPATLARYADAVVAALLELAQPAGVTSTPQVQVA